jgi:hypothetical protein
VAKDPNALPIDLDPAKAEDFGSRANTPVDCLVIHTTEGGSIAGAVEHWDRPDVFASAHYVIDGKRIVQRVAEGDAAYHAGNRAVNRRSIGIEIVGHAGRRETWTPDIVAQLVALSAEIVRRHAIPVVHQAGPGICGHADVPNPKHPDRRGGLSGHTDPGPFFPWGWFLESLRAELAGPVPPAPIPPPELMPSHFTSGPVVVAHPGSGSQEGAAAAQRHEPTAADGAGAPNRDLSLAPQETP